MVKILLVDDDGRARKSLAGVLMAAGHEITDFANASAAIEASKSQAYDVLLTDEDMPGMKGSILVRDRGIKRIPIKIIISGGFTLAGTSFVDDVWRVSKSGAQQKGARRGDPITRCCVMIESIIAGNDMSAYVEKSPTRG